MLRPKTNHQLRLPLLTLLTIGLACGSAFIATGSPRAHEDSGTAFGYDGDFGWSIVRDKGETNSGQIDRDLMRDLKDRYATPFLIISDKSDRYVITDEKLVHRAEDSAEEIQKYGKEIGEIAGAEAKLALSDTRHDSQKSEIERKRKSLEEEIRSGNPDRERLDDIENELFQLRIELHALEGVERGSRLTAEERDDLKERRAVAKKRLQVGIDRINEEMREILDTAKERGLAKKI